MSKNKFSHGFASEYNQIQKEKADQQRIKKKHNIDNENVIVVEKTGTGKFLIKTLITVIKTAAWIALIILAAVGIICLSYPETRNEFFNIISEIINYIFISN